MARIVPEFSAEKLKELQRALNKKDFNKAMVRAVRKASRDIKQKTAEAVAEHYQIGKELFGKSTRVNTTTRKDSLRIAFKSKRLRLALFTDSQAGKPVEVWVKNALKPMNKRTFVSDMYAKRGGDWRFGEHIQRHESGGSVRMLFTRRGDERYPIDALYTIATPQAVMDEDVSWAVRSFAAYQLHMAAAAVVSRALNRAQKA